MKQVFRLCMIAIVFFTLAGKAFCHFGMVIASDNMVMQHDDRNINVQLSFSHPMEMIGMELEKPKVFKVVFDTKHFDLLSALKPASVMDHSGWQLDYGINRPGVYVFYMEPQPYWEPAEDVFIIHYTKTIVAAFGDDDGWNDEIGLKTEIVPLSKPYGLYAGNVFQGIVKLDSKIVPNAQVEIEYYNRDKMAQAPSDYMVTQTIKADKNGVFTYGVPKSGWWGFSALNEADFVLKTPDGEEKDVELGAVLWVHFQDWQHKEQEGK
ncbi:MAG: DUF4198 domain-containing protein [Desulfobacteraceae bacterium]|nr:DUF4198 domain-containing protein [Desulfobacteraceae bacterium]